ncbi:MAG: lamin tail domain-containing protein, partial [Akkermansiaceae bacterium]|nr:lamin tail domain-containing protein [Akkermansiaceae bacterium]
PSGGSCPLQPPPRMNLLPSKECLARASIASLMVLLCEVPGASAQSLVISELMASNQDTLDDEDGDSEDWIEIFNQSGTAVNLDGWFLTDDDTNLRKWPIPSV